MHPLELVAWLGKYLLVFLIFVFILRIVRMVYLDLSAMRSGYLAGIPRLVPCREADVDNYALAFAYPLDRREIIFGRGRGADIRVRDPFVSNHHAKFFLDKDGFYVEDLRSANGVVLNGERIKKRARLRDGDILALGQVEFAFRQTEEGREGLARPSLPGARYIYWRPRQFSCSALSGQGPSPGMTPSSSPAG